MTSTNTYRRGVEPYESAAERAIREAIERGEFDDLPGKGRPLPNLHDQREDWWVRGYVRREGVPADALLPTGMQLRKEAERLSETVRDLPSEQAVRQVASELNLRIAAYVRNPEGPVLPVRRVDPDDLVEVWRAGRAARSEALREAREVPPRRRWRRRSS
ncbi:DnaJ family domain-containing protein [Pseudonocardia xishanensis]|uniref:DnaJ family domain-containing protein n=1 Tax=Pseudonocardia xishanensis TaxID=630995 RepID=UPI0031E4E5BE